MGDVAARPGAAASAQTAACESRWTTSAPGTRRCHTCTSCRSDVIKVDRSFVSELGQRDSALALTRSIVVLARALGLSVVAEGVETERQAGLLVGLGCDELQGFLYSRPVDSAAFEAFVAQRAALPLATA